MAPYPSRCALDDSRHRLGQGAPQLRVLVFEPRWAGHYLSYVRLAVDAALSAGCEAVVAIPDLAVRSEEFALHLADSADRFKLVTFKNDFHESRFAMARRLPAHLEQLKRDSESEALFFPTGDAIAGAIGLAHSVLGAAVVPFEYSETVLLRSVRAYGEERFGVRAHLGEIGLRYGSWSRVGSIDPRVAHWLERRVVDPAYTRVDVQPDPIDVRVQMTSDEARLRLGLDRDCWIVSSVGMNNPRKGIDLLLEAFCDATFSRPAVLLLAGKLRVDLGRAASLTQASSGAPKRIAVLDRHLNFDEFCAAIAASDLVATPYRSTSHPSSVVIHALAAARPVLAPSGGWFSYMVPAFGMGRLFNPRDRRGLRNGLEAEEKSPTRVAHSGAAKLLLQFQGRENAVLLWSRGLREHLGLPAPVGALAWERVVASLDGEAAWIPPDQ